MEVLSNSFLNELLKSCLKRQEVMQICVKHLKYEYIGAEPYKDIWKAIRSHYVNNGSIISYGLLSQLFNTGNGAVKMQQMISDIKEADDPSTEDIIRELEAFIKDSMSVITYNKFHELYTNEKRDEARAMLISSAEELQSLSIVQDTSYYDRVFAGFDVRSENRYNDHHSEGSIYKTVPFSIDELDYYYRGLLPTEMACFLLKSGGGKTKLLRHIAIGAARRGMKVLHIQAEGSRQECLDGYDASWTACLMSDIRKGSIDPDKYEKLRSISQQITNKGGEIYVHAFEQFKSASVVDIRNLLKDTNKICGEVDLVVADYLELFDPADGRRYSVDQERHRRLAIGEGMKNVIVEEGTRLATGTQATDVPAKLANDPEFVMTRSNISECKLLPAPFSFFVTGNQTKDEYSNNIMRLYVDKARQYRGMRTVKVKTNYDHDRFYDKAATIEMMMSIDKNFASELFGINDSE